MKKTEWIKAIEAEIEKKFDPAEVDGFENSAPAIKLGILADMYETEAEGIEKAKAAAYNELATMYETMAAWN